MSKLALLTILGAIAAAGTAYALGKVDLDKPSQIEGRPGVEMAVVDGELVMYGNEPCVKVHVEDNTSTTNKPNAPKKPKSYDGYVPKAVFDSLNVSTVSIPANFAGLEAEMVPTRLEEQLFRIVDVVEDEDFVTITARHVWYDNLENYTLWKPTEGTSYTAAAVCRNILENAISPVASRVASDCTDTKAGKELDFERKNLVEAFLDPENGVCAKFGLSLIRNNWDFYCLKDVGYNRGLVIQNGKNLLGVERKENIENLATRIAAYGKDDKGDIVWLNNNGLKYVDSQYINDYAYPHTEILDTGIQIGKDDVTAENIQSKLLAAAQARFTEDRVDLPSVEMTIQFLSLGDTEEYIQYRDLDKVYLYDILSIRDTIRGYQYTAQVVAVEHDILTGMLNSVTIGKLDNWDGTRKIAVWQVPEINGENIRLKSILAGAFEPGAINAADLANGSIQYVHFAGATIDNLISTNITAVTAQIHEIIAGSITADDIQTGSLTANVIAAGAIDTTKIAAYAVTADKINAGAVTTDKLDAGAITADKISTTDITAINAKLGIADIARAEIGIADINYLQVKDLTAGSAYFGQAIIQEGLANKLFIPRLSVVYAQMVSATVGDLVIQATNDNFYKLDVDMSGNVTATQVTPSAQEIEDGHTADGRTIYLGTDIVAEDLNTANIYASHALMDEITANIINVDQLFAREATITKINAMDLSSNTYIRSTIGNWASGSTITQTINSLDSRISSLGYGTVYFQETEPSHSELVQGDIWVQSKPQGTWQTVSQDYATWQEIENSVGTWQTLGGIPKMYIWDGVYWQEMYDANLPNTLQTQIEQLADQIALRATTSQVDALGHEVELFGAELTVQSEQIQAAVSAVDTKASSYVMWADPRDVYTVSVGDIWIKIDAVVATWSAVSNNYSTWQDIADTYDTWERMLGAVTYVWNGTEWVETSDRASEINQRTQITQTARDVTILATQAATFQNTLISLQASLNVSADRITAEVNRATIAESSKLDKTTAYQTADAIVTAAVSQASSSASGTYIAKTSVYQTANSIVAAAEEYTTNNAYMIKSGIAINASGIEVSGGKYVKIKSGGSFSVDSGNFSIDSSGNVSMTGAITATSGRIGGWLLGTNLLSSGSGSGYVALDSNTADTYAIWAGSATAGSAPFRVQRNGTVYLNALMVYDEATQQYVPVDFSRDFYSAVSYASGSWSGETFTARLSFFNGKFTKSVTTNASINVSSVRVTSAYGQGLKTGLCTVGVVLNPGGSAIEETQVPVDGTLIYDEGAASVEPSSWNISYTAQGATVSVLLNNGKTYSHFFAD